LEGPEYNPGKIISHESAVLDEDNK
jgi:hypothetical protein